MVPAMVRTAPEPTPNSRVAVNRGAAQLGMRGEAQIIVRAEVDNFLAVEIRDGLLLAFENLQIEVEMLGLEVFDGVMQILKLGTRGAAHNSSGGFCGALFICAVRVKQDFTGEAGFQK